MSLKKKKCKPCKGGEDPLDKKAIKKYRKELKHDWEVVDDKKIRIKLGVEDFEQAVKLFNDIADIAENQGHHPDMCITNYNHLSVVLYTHKIEGLHENDFIMASKIEELLKT